jgi:FdrA protein
MSEPAAPPRASIAQVLSAPPRVINVGVGLFADQLRAQGAWVVELDWRPPAGGNERLAELLARLT